MYCPNCGVRLETPQRYCSNCGAELPPTELSGTITGEVVTYGHAGFWLRLLAWLIDSIILGVAYFLISIPFALGSAFAFRDPFEFIVGPFLIWFMGIIINWLYYSIMESSSKQGTLGKMILGIVVTDMSGNRVSFGRATGRHFAKIISAIIFYIGFLMIAFTEKKQGLHDIIAETLVEVKRR